ncbi:MULTISPECIES: IMP cyclohydrolase [Paenibacillus]|uniref:IMP cyclohydrolase n=1 Tax=Paenibacillus TaxID=44249 RepID=UPI000F5205E0|nr:MULTISPECIES: IMP cyclohydrolase [Paenibacillus]KAA8748094.1 inosine monophosphate cyclohydrolase [Paenibacillus sp. UASWS1643]RPK27836.1 hypothetical protein EDO6_03359 [Paenibacillus xylanexedens]
MSSHVNEVLERNLKNLRENHYPGRGIVIGLTPDQLHYVQIYWIMGRSENSQNRIFVEENGFVRTEAFDSSKLTDPSLIIYSPIKFYEDHHIISNGDQTETIYHALSAGKTFENALDEREFEPDPPNFTPRISGLLQIGTAVPRYKLSILKSFYNDPQYCIRNIYNYEKAIPGFGHCITTYAANGAPIPSFEGEPFIVSVFDDINETLDFYWNTLNRETKVAVLAKYIHVENGKVTINCINKHSYSGITQS